MFAPPGTHQRGGLVFAERLEIGVDCFDDLSRDVGMLGPPVPCPTRMISDASATASATESENTGLF